MTTNSLHKFTLDKTVLNHLGMTGKPTLIGVTVLANESGKFPNTRLLLNNPVFHYEDNSLTFEGLLNHLYTLQCGQDAVFFKVVEKDGTREVVTLSRYHCSLSTEWRYERIGFHFPMIDKNEDNIYVR